MADPIQVSNYAEFIAAVGTDNTSILCTDDIDFTGHSNLTFGYNVIIDGGGHKFTNISCINTCFFKAPNAYSIIFNNINFEDMMFINTGEFNSNFQYLFFHQTSNNNGNIRCGFNNCDITAKIYLASPRAAYENNYHYVFSNISSITKCNIVIDVYKITPNSRFTTIRTGSSSDPCMVKDSILKINVYDPNGWAWQLADYSYPVLSTYLGYDNCGIFINYKANANLFSNTIMLLMYNNGYSSNKDRIKNTYFVYRNTGLVKLTPRIYNVYFDGYCFYDVGPADPSAPRSPADATKITWSFENCRGITNNSSFDPNLVKGLTTEDCKNRATFEDGYPAEGSSPAVTPFLFKLKQDYEP